MLCTRPVKNVVVRVNTLEFCTQTWLGNLGWNLSNSNYSSNLSQRNLAAFSGNPATVISFRLNVQSYNPTCLTSYPVRPVGQDSNGEVFLNILSGISYSMYSLNLFSGQFVPERCDPGEVALQEAIVTRETRKGCTATKSHLCVPFLGNVRPQSQFPNSCVSRGLAYIFPATE